MKVYSIKPSSGKYFEDRNGYFTDIIYNGTYRPTPIYPRFTFESSGRYNYDMIEPEIEFITMLPIKRFFGDYLVEINLKYKLNPYIVDDLNNAIKRFHQFCKDCEKNINVKSLDYEHTSKF